MLHVMMGFAATAAAILPSIPYSLVLVVDSLGHKSHSGEGCGEVGRRSRPSSHWHRRALILLYIGTVEIYVGDDMGEDGRRLDD